MLPFALTNPFLHIQLVSMAASNTIKEHTIQFTHGTSPLDGSLLFPFSFLTFLLAFFDALDTFLEQTGSPFGCFVSPFIQKELEYPLPNDMPLYEVHSFSNKIARFFLPFMHIKNALALVYCPYHALDAHNAKLTSIASAREDQLGGSAPSATAKTRSKAPRPATAAR